MQSHGKGDYAEYAADDIGSPLSTVQACHVGLLSPGAEELAPDRLPDDLSENLTYEYHQSCEYLKLERDSNLQHQEFVQPLAGGHALAHLTQLRAIYWDDEQTICYQVVVEDICVARRLDNNMINGTKLLNASGISRGRRDSLLKSEPERYVVKSGPMCLKGVWIPFSRALKYANDAGIVNLLYPLFVHDIYDTVRLDPSPLAPQVVDLPRPTFMQDPT